MLHENLAVAHTASLGGRFVFVFLGQKARPDSNSRGGDQETPVCHRVSFHHRWQQIRDFSRRKIDLLNNVIGFVPIHGHEGHENHGIVGRDGSVDTVVLARHQAQDSHLIGHGKSRQPMRPYNRHSRVDFVASQAADDPIHPGFSASGNDSANKTVQVFAVHGDCRLGYFLNAPSVVGRRNYALRQASESLGRKYRVVSRGNGLLRRPMHDARMEGNFQEFRLT
mmetsp:Transcript_8786/g.21670  ORF Transcript_8786/g.21670 Transcript_8786/m.21670 type:complete len:224 (+) Transcript_8786:102-773(+)